MTNQSFEISSKKNKKQALKNRSFLSAVKHNCVQKIPSTNKQKLPDPDSIYLYNKENIDKIRWPNNEASYLVKNFFLPFVQNGTAYYIDNIDAEINILLIKEQVIPVLIINNQYKNSYICSPYGHYISLALETLFVIKNKSLRKIAETTLNWLGRVLKRGDIDKIIYIDHWLFSTDLHTKDFNVENVDTITNLLKQKFPHHAIAFRSLNSYTTKSLKNVLELSGFKMIASRQIYLTDTDHKEIFNTRIIKSDFKLWKDNDFEIIEITKNSDEKDKQRILELYNTVSIEHHTSLNPKFNYRFIELLTNQQLLQLKVFKKNGIIEGVVGYTKKESVLMCPFFGYNKNLQTNTKLYRLLSTYLLLEAKKDLQIFHQSAGASFYKTIRRASSHLEYLGVYTKHLHFKQKSAWWILRQIFNHIAIPFMRKY